MDYKKIIIYVTLLIIAILFMLLLKDCSEKGKKNNFISEWDLRDWDEITEEGIIRIVTEYNQVGYFVEGDTISGFQYELGSQFGKDMGLQVEIYPVMDLQKSIEGLENREYDIIARNISITAALKMDLSFTEPLILNKQVLVQRKAEFNNGIQPIRNQLDLAKKTLYVPENSPSRLRINNLSQEIGDTVYVREMEKYESEQLIIMVAKGDIDYAVCDEVIARKLTSHLPEIDINTDISFTQLNAWAVRKDSPVLLDSLNNWVIRLKNNKKIEKMQRQYFK